MRSLALAAVLLLTGCDIPVAVDCGAGPCPDVLVIYIEQIKTTTTSPSTEADVSALPGLP